MIYHEEQKITDIPRAFKNNDCRNFSTWKENILNSINVQLHEFIA